MNRFSVCLLIMRMRTELRYQECPTVSKVFPEVRLIARDGGSVNKILRHKALLYKTGVPESSKNREHSPAFQFSLKLLRTLIHKYDTEITLPHS
jgi:hypothetical protein